MQLLQEEKMSNINDVGKVGDMVNKAWADGKAEGHGEATAEASVVIGALRARILTLEAERAEREHQEPVAWYVDGDEGREYNGAPEMSCGRTGIPLYVSPTSAFTPPFRFCPRCGKDLKDMPIHTCTPPREKGGA